VTSPLGKILVVRGGAIGDFILTLPAIAALRQQFPKAHLEVLGYPHIAQLALAGGLVDGVQPIEARALASFFARNGGLDDDFADYFSEFDLIISYLYDPDEIFRTNIARCSGAQFLQGPHRPEEGQRVHATKVYLQPLERLAIFDADAVPRLRAGRTSRLSQTKNVCVADSHSSCDSNGNSETGATPVLRTLALHPGSGSERKNWPEEKWAELLQHLTRTTTLDLLLVGGEAEGQRLQRLAAVLPTTRLEIAQSLSLAELAQRIRGCMAFVGHDSGISHLAAALGVPCLVLWADTAEEVWRPQGERLVIVREPGGVRATSVERVVRELNCLLEVP
jgi:heptosyltransferase III